MGRPGRFAIADLGSVERVDGDALAVAPEGYPSPTRSQQQSPKRKTHGAVSRVTGASLLVAGIVCATATSAYAASTAWDGNPIVVQSENLAFLFPPLGDDAGTPYLGELAPEDIVTLADVGWDGALDYQFFEVFDDSPESSFRSSVRCANPQIQFASPGNVGEVSVWNVPNDADAVITCDARLIDTGDASYLQATPELRIWGDRGLSRYAVTLTNLTDEPLSYSYQFGTGFPWSSLSGIFRATSNRPSLPAGLERGTYDFGGDRDFYWTMTDGDSDSHLPSVIAWGNKEQFAPSVLDAYENYLGVYRWGVSAPNSTAIVPNVGQTERYADPSKLVPQLSLEANESATFAFFNFSLDPTGFEVGVIPTGFVGNNEPRIVLVNDTPDYEDYLNALFSAATETFGGSGDGTGVLASGVPCDLFEGLNLSQVANWNCDSGDTGGGGGTGGGRDDDTDSDLTVTPVAEPGLVATGSDTTALWLGFTAAALLVAAGAGVLLVSHRKRVNL